MTLELIERRVLAVALGVVLCVTALAGIAAVADVVILVARMVRS